jgi:hypothetical protein
MEMCVRIRKILFTKHTQKILIKFPRKGIFLEKSRDILSVLNILLTY